MPRTNGGVSGDVAGFGPVGTRLLVPRPNGGISGDVVGFGPVGTRLLVPTLEGRVSVYERRSYIIIY